MKVLKDPVQALQIMDKKLDKLRKKFYEYEDRPEEAEIHGQEISIICVKNHISCAIKRNHSFDEDDMEGVYKYAADTKRNAREYGDIWDTRYMKGRADGAAWACVWLEDRMEEP